MKNDLRFALRMIATHRWFSAAIIVTLALGIGVNTTVFTFVNAILFKPVPVPGGARLVTVSAQDLTRSDSRMPVFYLDFQEFRQNNRTFENLEGVQRTQIVISEQGNPPDRYSAVRVSPGLLTMLKTPPVLGREFGPEDGKAGAESVVLISHGVWKNRYGSDPSVLGRVVRVNSAPATIIGVMPEGFKFPRNEDVWMPLVPTADLGNRSGRGSIQLFGLLKPGTTIEEAGADLAVIAKRLSTEFPATNKNLGAIVQTFHDAFNGGRIRMVFLTMMGAVGFVLLIACANVANLMLSRAIARRREIAVRAAVGASRWQIVRQLLVESVLLSSLGGVLGLGLAMAGVHAFDVATQDVGKPYWIQFTMDYVVFSYFAVISVASGLLFGLVPALRASRVDLNIELKDGTLGAGSSSGGKLMAVLVALQFALTVVLLAGAGLMVRSFFAAQAVNGFVPVERIFTARLMLPEGKGQRYAQAADRLRFYDELFQRVATLPAVTQVSATSHLPGMGGGNREIEIEGKPLDTATPARVTTGVHSPHYLATIGLPIIAGRGFHETDGETGKEVAIVTREFAAKHWPNQPVVGARFRFLEGNEKKGGAWVTVVGVCGDIVQRGNEADAPPLVYTPLRQEPTVWMTLVVRTAGEPSTLAPAIRAIVQNLDQDLPLYDLRTLTDAAERENWPLKVFGTLFFSFAVIALLIASVGLYAVVAQATGRRTREIGIRMALGATAARIMQLVLSRGLMQLGVGLVLGLGGALVATELLAEMRLLFGISPQDPLVFAAVTTLLIAIGVLACWLPARRAAALHPVNALRHE